MCIAETAKATLGTCQDMCPEYERYFREDTNQVSLLEMNNNNQPDPFAMVKEYRRAGADQEEPLPHELRSPEALQRTCDYIVCNILDRVEEDPSIISEWYDFVWSRTRAIRKDITQQHLCDKTAVSILEKCARFHIHCAEALCEEDISVFDPKINNENLNKCIQSLKDFYTDLCIKDIVCENEPEFLGYYLLLNLKHNDILREAKYFPKSIRESEPVKFAISCYFALTSNNFVKFFNLVNEATYLNACILHRYFHKVRVQAFKILRKSHTIPNQIESYPADELIRQLGFTGENELTIFCQNIGLSVDNNCVILKRGRTLDTNNETNIIRSLNLIEIKRQGIRLSKIINGQKLPPNPYGQYQLSESFDQYGLLKKDNLNIYFTRDKTLFSSESDQPDSQQQLFHSHQPQQSYQVHHHSHHSHQSYQNQNHWAKPEVPQYSDELRTAMVFQIAETIFDEVIQSMVIDVIQEMVTESYVNFFKQTFDEVLTESVLDCCNKVYFEEKKAFETNQQYQMALTHVAQIICESLINETISQLVHSIVTNIYSQELNIFVTSQSTALADLLITEVTQEVIYSIVVQYYQQALNTQNEFIEMMRAKRSKRLAKNYFNFWWKRCLKARRYNQIKQRFPASSIENILSSVHSISFKRRLSNSDTDTSFQSNHEPKCTKKDDQDALKPKLFADAVASVSKKTSSLSRTNSNSRLEEIKAKLEEEKARTKSFRKSLETFKYSLSYSEKHGDEEDEDIWLVYQ